VAPGSAVPLEVNLVRVNLLNDGKIFLYKIDWSITENVNKDECIRNLKDDLHNVIGLFFYYDDIVYSS